MYLIAHPAAIGYVLHTNLKEVFEQILHEGIAAGIFQTDTPELDPKCSFMR
jgi:hypothetical protein